MDFQNVDMLIMCINFERKMLSTTMEEGRELRDVVKRSPFVRTPSLPSSMVLLSFLTQRHQVKELITRTFVKSGFSLRQLYF